MGRLADKALAYLATLTEEEFDLLLEECVAKCNVPSYGYSLVLPMVDDLENVDDPEDSSEPNSN